MKNICYKDCGTDKQRFCITQNDLPKFNRKMHFSVFDVNRVTVKGVWDEFSTDLLLANNMTFKLRPLNPLIIPFNPDKNILPQKVYVKKQTCV